MPKMIKLTDWADKHGLHYLTANRHFHAGMIPGVQLESGTILVEDDSPEQNTMGNVASDAISLFLKKTVEFSKNNGSIEDFAAYVISNFQLKILSTPENPRYSKQKPKPEDVQRHFQQFIPKGEKPKTNAFVMEPEAFDDIPSMPIPTTAVNPEQLAKDFTQAVNSIDYSYPYPPTSASISTLVGSAEAMSFAENSTTQSVDLNTTPQSINYTGSTSASFGDSLTSGVINNVATNTILGTMPVDNVASVYFTNSVVPSPVGSFQPTRRELQSLQNPADVRLSQPRGKRGRKSSKK
jgi:hypothetical protein